jgi:molybdate transport system regulatory protein
MADCGYVEGAAARVTTDGVTFGERDAALLRAVDRSGSLHAATSMLERSYSRAHARLANLEEAFGTLVSSHRGGAGGGGTELTDRGRSLLLQFDRFNAALNGVAGTDETAFAGEVTDRRGELATVETAAGPLRAVVPTDVTSVSVAIRADAVTLQEPADVPDPEATSARNRLTGTVTTVTWGPGTVSVGVDVGAGHTLMATVTTDSARRLDLEPDRELVAAFKATATRGVPRQTSRV